MGIFCGKRCQDRKDRRLELRYEKKLARIDAKVEKAKGRQETRQSAYSKGIDVGSAKSIFGGIAKVGAVVGGTITGTSAIKNLSDKAINQIKAGEGKNISEYDIENLTQTKDQQSQGGFGIMAIVAVVLMALMSKAK